MSSEAHDCQSFGMRRYSTGGFLRKNLNSSPRTIHNHDNELVHRGPASGKPRLRSDPFWEVGSFGYTGCHDDNLLNLKKEHVKTRDRLAFVEGDGQDANCSLILLRWALHQKRGTRFTLTCPRVNDSVTNDSLSSKVQEN